MLDEAVVKKYRRQKFLRRIQHMFWSTICIVGVLVLLYIAIQYMTPWLDTLNETVTGK